jgi:phenylalanyl-tRNA synthetase beta subunit
MYQNDESFWEENISITIKITFRSIERTLTNDEINKMYFEIREKIVENLGYKLR